MNQVSRRDVLFEDRRTGLRTPLSGCGMSRDKLLGPKHRMLGEEIKWFHDFPFCSDTGINHTHNVSMGRERVLECINAGILCICDDTVQQARTQASLNLE